MSNMKTFTITDDGIDGGGSTTLYSATCDGADVLIAALTGQFKNGQTCTSILADASGSLYNGHKVDYLAGPDA